MSDEIKVGTSLWAFDENLREWVDGKMVPGCHFHEVEVTGETPRSWIIGEADSYYGSFKVPKKNPFPDENPRIYTDQMKEDAVWMEKNRDKISDATSRYSGLSVSKYRQIAKILEIPEDEK